MDNGWFCLAADQLARDVLKKGGRTISERDVHLELDGLLAFSDIDVCGGLYDNAREVFCGFLKSAGWLDNFGVYFFRGSIEEYVANVEGLRQFI